VLLIARERSFTKSSPRRSLKNLNFLRAASDTISMMASRVKRLLAIAFQALTAMVWVLSPLWLRKDFEQRTLQPEVAKVSLSSRVVQLPDPLQLLSNKMAMKVTIETKQFRFEKLARARLPASKAAASWILARIERRSSGGWESVGLVESEAREPMGSVFIEVEDGTAEEFRVSFKDVRGKTTSYQVFVEHLPPNNS
jgi:hypothetical protein